MAEHEHNDKCFEIEVYTHGVLFWECSDGEYRHRWPSSDPRHHTAAAYIAKVRSVNRR